MGGPELFERAQTRARVAQVPLEQRVENAVAPPALLVPRDARVLEARHGVEHGATVIDVAYDERVPGDERRLGGDLTLSIDGSNQLRELVGVALVLAHAGTEMGDLLEASYPEHGELGRPRGVALAGNPV